MAVQIPKLLLPPPAISPTQLAAPYEVYRVESETLYDGGLLAMTPAATTPNSDGAQPEQPVIIVQVSTPYASRIVSFEMVRYGCECIPPDPTPRADSNGNALEALMRAEIKEGIPNPAEDANSAKWTMSGRYVYVVLIPGVQAAETTLQSVPVQTPTYQG